MKRLPLFLAIFVAILSAPCVRAESVQLGDDHIASIVSGCQSALRGIKRVQEAEAATRVNRGQAYEKTIKLMSALNSRMALSKLDEPLMGKALASAQRKLDQFHVHYLDYAEKMDQTLAIHCREAPVSFYDSLNSARYARSVVAGDILEIEKLLDEYQQGVQRLSQQVDPRSLPQNGATQ